MNTEEFETVNDINESQPQQPFGERFRLAREAARLSIIDVSESLKLPEETITALEDSRIDLLPPRAFAQGYIRNYARLLKLSEDEILEILEQFSAEKKTTLSARSSLPRQISSGETKIKLLTYGLVLAGVLTMFIWWFQSVSEIVEPETESSAAIEFSGVDNALAENAIESADVVVDQSVVDSVPVMADEVVVEVKVKEPVPVVKVAPVPAPAVKKIEVIKQKEKLADPVEIKNNTARIDAEKKVSGEVSEFLAAAGEDVLILGTVSESWAEVQDANDAQLVFELLKKGGYYRVKGRAPFKIFLGNAPSVSMQINGKPVDVLKYLRSDNLTHVYIDNHGEVSSAGRRENADDPIKTNNSLLDE